MIICYSINMSFRRNSNKMMSYDSDTTFFQKWNICQQPHSRQSQSKFVLHSSSYLNALSNPCLQPVSRKLMKSSSNNKYFHYQSCTPGIMKFAYKADKIEDQKPLVVERKEISDRKKSESIAKACLSENISQRRNILRANTAKNFYSRSSENSQHCRKREFQDKMRKRFQNRSISKIKILSLKQACTNPSEALLPLNPNLNHADIVKQTNRPKTGCLHKKRSHQRNKKQNITRPSPMNYLDSEESDFRAWDVESQQYSQFM